MTAQEAAKLFVSGELEECLEWCCCLHPDSKPCGMMVRGESAATRTAAVALKLGHVEEGSFMDACQRQHDFLRMMAGEDTE